MKIDLAVAYGIVSINLKLLCVHRLSPRACSCWPGAMKNMIRRAFACIAIVTGLLLAPAVTPTPVEGVIININFPDAAPEDVTRIEATRLGRRDERMAHVEKRTDLRGYSYYWVGYHGVKSNPPEGTDLRAIYEGRISVTPLHLEMTHESERAKLERALLDLPLNRGA
jgi:5'/3'-nucleotidase SurE